MSQVNRGAVQGLYHIQTGGVWDPYPHVQVSRGAVQYLKHIWSVALLMWVAKNG